jgi:hypothetical protein
MDAEHRSIANGIMGYVDSVIATTEHDQANDHQFADLDLQLSRAQVHALLALVYETHELRVQLGKDLYDIEEHLSGMSTAHDHIDNLTGELVDGVRNLKGPHRT